MTTRHTDLLVIGAGPAGTAAAIEARRAGRDVLVIDKAHFPRDKCCGDGLTAGALRHLDELGLDPTTVPSWQVVNDVNIAGPNGRSRVFPLPRSRGQFAAITRRRELDAALVDLARSNGADVLEGEALSAIENTSSTVTATTSTLTITADHVVAADGMWSPTRKLLGLGTADYRGEWHAFRQYFRNVSEQAATELVVWFDADLLPGYIWSFPLADGSANVGFGIQRGRAHSIQDMRALWPDILQRPHVRDFLGTGAIAEDRHTAWPIPARLGRTVLSNGRVLFVGDAAAATDPMTGEGIGQAIETGRVAGRLIGSTTSPTDIASAYEKEIRRGMVRDHSLARSLSAVLGTRAGATASVAIAGLTPWTRRNFARWLFEDYPRAVVGTPHRWHRSLFNQDGAFTSQGALDKDRTASRGE